MLFHHFTLGFDSLVSLGQYPFFITGLQHLFKYSLRYSKVSHHLKSVTLLNLEMGMLKCS